MKANDWRNVLVNEIPFDPLTAFYEYVAEQAIVEEIKRFTDHEITAIPPAQAGSAKSSKEQIPILSEAEALRLIAADDAFLAVEAHGIAPADAGEPIFGKHVTAKQNETRASVAARHRREVFNRLPVLWVFLELGLTTLALTPVTKTKLDAAQSSGIRRYTEHWRLTERGRKSWKNSGHEIDEKSLPIFRRRATRITELNVENATTVSAKYRWRIEPNEISSCFVAGSREFEALPEKLKELFTRTKTADSLREHLDRERIGEAYFNYDGGSWQVTEICGYDA